MVQTLLTNVFRENNETVYDFIVYVMVDCMFYFMVILWFILG